MDQFGPAGVLPVGPHGPCCAGLPGRCAASGRPRIWIGLHGPGTAGHPALGGSEACRHPEAVQPGVQPEMSDDRNLHLSRLTVDGFVIRRRSATLRFGPGAARDDPPWAVDIRCRSLPSRFQPGTAVHVDAVAISGHRIAARALISTRSEDTYGTRFVLTGIEQLTPRTT